jgi:hypothetical protein
VVCGWQKGKRYGVWSNNKNYEDITIEQYYKNKYAEYNAWKPKYFSGDFE